MFEGKGLIIHNLPANGTFLGQRLNYYAVDWAAFKIHDGGSPWGESRNVTRQYVDDIRKVYRGELDGWGYCYCDGLSNGEGVDADGVPLNDRGNGIPELEAAAATTKLEELGLDGYIADFEKQCEGHPDLVMRFIDAFESGWDGVVGGPIKVPFKGHRGAFVWASLDGHRDYPYQHILEHWLGAKSQPLGTGVLMPMVYRPTWDAKSITEWRGLWAEQQISPTVSIYAPDFEAVKADVSEFLQTGLRGINVWSGDAFMQATNLMPKDVQDRSNWFRNLSVPVLGPPVSHKADASRWLDPIWNTAGDLVNAGFRTEGLAVQQAIRWGKHELSDDEFCDWIKGNG